MASAGVMVAGMVLTQFSSHNQRKIMELGRKIEADQLETNLQLIKTQAAEASLDEMKQLRQNIGSQIAIQAERGTAGGAGSAGSVQQESVSQFGKDEQTRRLNLLAKQSALRAGGAATAISTFAGETQLGQSVTNKIFQTFDTRGVSDFLFNPLPERDLA